PKATDKPWSFKFYFGNSKNIKKVELDDELKQSLAPIVNTTKNEIFTECIDLISSKYKNIDSNLLQKSWTSTENPFEVFEFLDEVGDCVNTILDEADFSEFDTELIKSILNEENRKLEEHKDSALVGFYFLSSLNTKLF
ncbi:MAG: hypothetical protein RIF46_01980, partial [Cyclobacteriaceae bacterium]